MAEFLYASSHITGNFPNPANAVGNTPGTWAGDLNTNSNYTSRWAMANPTEPGTLQGTQTIRVVARKGSNSANPQITINVFENGTLVSGLGTLVTITSTTGQTVTKTFDGSLISDPSAVEVEVVQDAQGGNQSTRNSAQISHIELEAVVGAAPIPSAEGEALALELTLGDGIVPVPRISDWSPLFDGETITPAEPVGFLGRGVNLSGAEFAHQDPSFSNTNPGVEGVGYTFPSQGSIAYLASRGVSLIRLPFKWERVQPTLFGALNADYLAGIRQAVEDANALGITVILDVHNYGAYMLDVDGNPTRVTLGSDELPYTALADLWERLAAEFSSDDVVYDLNNEPANIAATASFDADTLLYDFDAGVQGWFAEDSNGTLTHNTSIVHSAGGSLRAQHTSMMRVRHPGGGLPVGTEAIGVWVYVPVGAPGPQSAEIHVYNSEWANTVSEEGATPLTQGQWTQVVGSFPGTDLTTINAVIVQLNGEAIDAYLDTVEAGTTEGIITGAQHWENASQVAVTAVRAIDPDTPILVGGYQWSNMASWPDHHPTAWITGNRVVYSAHQYWDFVDGQYAAPYDQTPLDGHASVIDRALHQLNIWKNWLDENDVEGYIGEFGWPHSGHDPNNWENWNAVGEEWLTHVADLTGWTYWATSEWFESSYEILIYDNEGSGALSAPMSQASIVEAAWGFDETPIPEAEGQALTLELGLGDGIVQVPEAGVFDAEGQALALTVALGDGTTDTPTATIPDVEGQALALELGLGDGIVQVPEAGVPDAEGQALALELSLGDGTTDRPIATIPDEEGQSLALELSLGDGTTITPIATVPDEEGQALTLELGLGDGIVQVPEAGVFDAEGQALALDLVLGDGTTDTPTASIPDEEGQALALELSLGDGLTDTSRFFYTTSLDGTLRKFDPNGDEVWSVPGLGTLVAVAVDHDGFVYAGSEVLRKFDPNGDEVWTFSELGPGHLIRHIAVDHNSFVYVAVSDQTVRKIGSDGNEVWSFTGHTGPVLGVAVDANGFVYSASGDETARKIDPDGNEVWSFTGHTSPVHGVVVDANGFVYTAGGQEADHTVRKINPDGNEVWSFTDHTGAIPGIDVDENGFVYTASVDGTVRKIDPDGNEVWSFTGHTDVVHSVVVDPEGFVYTGSFDATARKIDADGNEVWVVSDFTQPLYKVAVDGIVQVPEVSVPTAVGDPLALVLALGDGVTTTPTASIPNEEGQALALELALGQGIAQAPEAGIPLAQGQALALSIDLGDGDVTIPTASILDAEGQALALELALGQGIVQAPEAGVDGVEGQALTLALALGDGETFTPTATILDAEGEALTLTLELGPGLIAEDHIPLEPEDIVWLNPVSAQVPDLTTDFELPGPADYTVPALDSEVQVPDLRTEVTVPDLETDTTVPDLETDATIPDLNTLIDIGQK